MGNAFKQKASATHYNAQLELADKGRAIKVNFMQLIFYIFQIHT